MHWEWSGTVFRGIGLIRVSVLLAQKGVGAWHLKRGEYEPEIS